MAETAVARAVVTRREYRKLPEGPPYFELLGGELVEMTRPLRSHQQLLLLLGHLWIGHIRAGTGGELTPEPNLFLPGVEDVCHPDLVYVRPEQRGICREDGIHGVPDVVCEILSPSTQRRDRYVKMELFRRAGVANVWLFDPDSPVTVEEYVLQPDEKYRLNATVSSPDRWQPAGFPGWRIEMAELDAAVASA